VFGLKLLHLFLLKCMVLTDTAYIAYQAAVTTVISYFIFLFDFIFSISISVLRIIGIAFHEGH
jgi:hypothetical protein